MRGGYLHNRILVEALAQKASQLGFRVDREVPIAVGKRVLYGDLLIQRHSQSVLVEAELSPRRIDNDLLKATASGAGELWLVVPNSCVARSVRRGLSLWSRRPRSFALFVLSLPQALQRLRNFSELFSASNVETENKCDVMEIGGRT